MKRAPPTGPLTADELEYFRVDPLTRVLGSPGYWAGRLLATIDAQRIQLAGVQGLLFQEAPK